MLCSFFRICFPSAIFFQFVVFVVISAMSFVCLLYFSWICFFLPFSFLFCCRSILSTHLMFISSTSSRSNWQQWKSANRTKIRIFTRKWTRIPKNAFHNRSNRLFITEKCKRMQFSFHLLQSRERIFTVCVCVSFAFFLSLYFDFVFFFNCKFIFTLFRTGINSIV